MYKGQVISHDKDIACRDLFSIQYLNGDHEDLFLNELLRCVMVEITFRVHVFVRLYLKM